MKSTLIAGAALGWLFLAASGASAQQPTSLTNAWGAPWMPPSSSDRQVGLNQADQLLKAQSGVLALPPNYYNSYSQVQNIGNWTQIEASGGSSIDANIDQSAPDASQSGSANATVNMGSGGFKTYTPIIQK
jgi:hypothetical protein